MLERHFALCHLHSSRCDSIKLLLHGRLACALGEQAGRHLHHLLPVSLEHFQLLFDFGTLRAVLQGHALPQLKLPEAEPILAVVAFKVGVSHLHLIIKEIF